MKHIEPVVNPEKWFKHSHIYLALAVLLTAAAWGYFWFFDNLVRGPVTTVQAAYAADAQGKRKRYFKQGDIVYMRLEHTIHRKCPGVFDTTLINNISVAIPTTRRTGTRRLDKHTIVIPILTITRAQTPGNHKVIRMGSWDCNGVRPITAKVADFDFVVLD